MVVTTPVKSPFKFLDAYTVDDTDRFFGRQAEQQRLIELIFSSRLILLYGASGTGKSSLVQCGLAKALSQSDYFPVVIRRKGNLPSSLINTLTDLVQDPSTTNPVVLTQVLVDYALSPVYLIFDQFEELFISGNRAEQEQFFEMLGNLYDAGVSCKLLLSMREEYLAFLYAFEDQIPGLFDHRLRVEPMRERNLEDVILGTLHQVPEIRLEMPAETVALILRNARSEKNIFQLPYLQVYLDRLWRVGFEKSRFRNEPTVRINPELIQSVGAIDDVLELFLREQKQFMKAALPATQHLVVDRLLEAFVTFEGTRREHTMESLVGELDTEPEAIVHLLTQLESLRILKEDEGRFELPHDSLAKVIDQGRSAEQRQINDIIRWLKDGFRDYHANKETDFLLTPRRLTEIELHEDALRFELKKTPENEEIWRYIETSTHFVQKNQKTAKRRKIRRIVLLGSAIVVILLLIISTLYAIIMKTMASQSEKDVLSRIEQSSTEWQNGVERAEKVQSAYLSTLAYASDELSANQAIRLLSEAYQIDNNSTLINARLLKRFNDGTVFQSKQPVFEHKGVINSAVFSDDGNRIVTASDDKTAKVWDLQGNRLAVFPHEAAVNSACFSRDGRRIVTASDDKTSRIWDMNGNLQATLPHEGVVNTAVFSQVTDSIITASDDKTAKIWDSKGKLLKSYTHQGGVKTALFLDSWYSMDLFLTASSDKTASIWNGDESVRTTVHHQGPVNTAIFYIYFDIPTTPFGRDDGKRSVILTASDDKTAILWDMEGNKTQVMKHKDPVKFAASNFKNIILTASGDKTVLVWDFHGNRMGQLDHQQTVTTASFSKNGNYIVTAAGKQATIWITPKGGLEWLKAADSKIPPLSEANKKRYGIVGPLSTRK